MQISVASPPPPSASRSAASTPVDVATPSTSGSTGESHASDLLRWQVKFGFWSDLDVLYSELPPPRKPRIPSQQLDGAQEWAKRMVPTSAASFLGNPTALQCLHGLHSGDASPLTNFIVSGGEYTGKLSFIGLLRLSLSSSGFDPPCAFGSVNAKHFGEKDLLLKIEDFVRRVDPHRVKAAFLVVERFESVTPSTQQHFLLPILQDANAKSVFLIFHVRPDAAKVAEQIKQRAVKVHLHALKPIQVRAKLLHICQQEQIGFTRDGLEELLRRCEFKLLPSMEKLHQVFLSQFFISLPNVRKKQPKAKENSSSSKPIVKPEQTKCSLKSSKPEPPPFALSILEMSEPLRRCKKCTLLPPCRHVTLEMLHDKVQRIRNLYPHQDDDDDDEDCDPEAPASSSSPPPPPAMCPSFLRSGVCSNIQSLGRCRYAHPLSLHSIDTSQLVQRCRVHTLPPPCTHCANVNALKDQLRTEIKACMQLDAQVRALRKQLSDLEMDKFLFARDRAKNAKWGAAKREGDDKLAHFDAALASLRADVEALGRELAARQARRDRLESDNERGKSHGSLSSSKSTA